MTITYYTARFHDGSNNLWVAEVYWDKNHQGKILARISREIGKGVLDYPYWNSDVSYGGPESLATLRQRIMAKAAKDCLVFDQEYVTEYAPPKHFRRVTKPETN
jgi:hypothetical protein